jgi:hypothetical protein
MRRAAPLSWVIVVCLVQGCSTMRPGGSQHPGLTEVSPNAITRTFPASATLVARTVADVMSEDSIIDNVSMTPDKGKEFRNFSRADRQSLGIAMLAPTNDVNYNITARSKDGHPITVAVRLKGDSGSEVSVLYGSGGDPELSRDILDKAEAVLARPSKDPGLARANSTKPATPKAEAR